MNPLVVKFLADESERKQNQLAEEKEEKREAYRKALIEKGYFEKLYAPESVTEWAGEYPASETDEKSGKTRYYNRVLELTDEDVEALERNLSIDTIKPSTSGNAVGLAVKIIAYLNYIGAFIAAIALANTYYGFQFGIFMGILVAGAIGGTFILGFAEIIELLYQINNKK